MRTDTRTLEERIADRDAKRVVATIEQAAIQASCETRRLWGQQAQAFAAAALPLCAPCDPTAVRYNRSRLAGAPRDSQRS
jgi:hypothetical protein